MVGEFYNLQEKFILIYLLLILKFYFQSSTFVLLPPVVNILKSLVEVNGTLRRTLAQQAQTYGNLFRCERMLFF